ncbi:kinase-like protein [Lophiostoma macrostomum CBS 122681]|uniref:non-specific serine/threonine protein kinase n=1 Tax=Lophiostoma macrostomum CBS 122681 TaxID=1314788 RepID=A0A6A6T0D1_9PLEO|nr:kinase-like protein [Lophiostoma macrostomum CBS 122681]
MAKGSPWNKAYQYFAQTVRDTIRIRNPEWRKDEITRTVAYLWWDPNLDRTPFVTAVERRSTLTVPFPPLTIPPAPVSKTQLLKKRKDYEKARDIEAPTIPAIPAVIAGPDIYPFSFRPDTWESESDIGDIPNLRAWDDQNRGEDPTIVRNQWLKLKVNMEGDDPTQRWHGVRFIAQGSFGSCGLFVQVDENDVVQDRMVVKENCPTREEWNDPTQWRRRKPREIDIHERIEHGRRTERDEQAFSHLVHYRGHRVMMKHRRFRLYLDLHSGGDLSIVADDFFQMWARGSIIALHDRSTIPEPYIWYILNTLVEAVCVLRSGRVSSQRDGWKPITHCDLKLNNILMDITEEGSKHWPRPVLTDFGMAFYELYEGDNPNLSDNPREYVNDMSGGSYAHEQAHMNVNNPVKLNEKTDVWAIGKVIWNLVTHSKDAPAREIPGIPTVVDMSLLHEEEILTGAYYSASEHYGDPLKELVRACLAYDQADRPTLDELKGRIESAFTDDPGLREQVPTSFFIYDEYKDWTRETKYRPTKD